MSQQLAPDDSRTAAFVRTDDVARPMSDRSVGRHHTTEHGDICVGESQTRGIFCACFALHTRPLFRAGDENRIFRRHAADTERNVDDGNCVGLVY